ncbi:MAG: hypothetical protein II797_00580, partial [Clostridia bacterium]|nr:hypothetical protein [Clostridia bacterium]
NTYSIGSGQSNIEGLRVSEAVKTYHSRQIDANFIWETAHILYIPNAEVEAAYDYTLVPSSMDVEKGLYPNDYNSENDLFWDKETGLLYVIATVDDNGDYGRVKHLFVMDTNQPAAEEQLGLEAPFKIVYHTDLRFLYGFNTQYFQHFYKDTEGNLYLIAVSNNSSEIEIWKAESATDPSAGFRLVHTEPFRGYADASKRTINVYGMIIATNRNNSVTGDQAHLITYWTDVNHWFHYTVDFAALRAILGI